MPPARACVRISKAPAISCSRRRGSPDGSIVVVDRGFVPLDRKDMATRAQGAPHGTVDIVGVMRWPESRGMFTPADDVKNNVWYLRDPAAMAQAKNWGEIAPFYIDQEAPVPPGGLPLPGKLVVHLPDNHLQYAITWFGLALGLAGVYAVWLAGAAAPAAPERAAGRSRWGGAARGISCESPGQG